MEWVKNKLAVVVLAAGLTLPPAVENDAEGNIKHNLPGWAFKLAKGLNESGQRDIEAFAKWKGIHYPDMHSIDRDCFDGVYYMFVRRAMGVPIGWPGDPLGRWGDPKPPLDLRP